jgi:hypothetical protein
MDMPRTPRCHLLIALAVVTTALGAKGQDAADRSIEQFLARSDGQPSYRAARKLEAQNGSRRGWLEAVTTYSPATGFAYEITDEGGSGYIRDKVLRAVLQGEQEIIARGEAARSSLEPSNYTFLANGVDEDGLAKILISPRRKERVLISGTMFLRAAHGDLVRLQGRLAKNPSFWIKNVDVVRKYERIDGVIVPVSLESTAQLRFLGSATLRMTYTYSEIDGREVGSLR